MDTLDAWMIVATPFVELWLSAIFAIVGGSLLTRGVEKWFEGKIFLAITLLLSASVAVFVAAISFMTLTTATFNGIWPNYTALVVELVPILIESAVITLVVMVVMVISEFKMELSLYKD